MQISRRQVLAGGAAGIATLSLTVRGDAQTKSPAKGAPVKFNHARSEKRADIDKATAVTDEVILRNQSSKAVVSARFGMSDDSGAGDPIVKEVTFGRISSGSTARKTETFPTGVEKILYTLFVEGDPEPYSGFGLGDNAVLVELTLTD
jgi:hypothetical protein